MITIKNDLQLAKMRSAGHLLYDVLCQLREKMSPGMTTLDLDRYAHELITHAHATPSFLGYEGYPATLCVSIDDEVVHGIPSKHIEMKEGSIVSVDCGLVLDGWQADSAFTKGMGQISPECAQLIEVTERCFFEGARQAVDGNRLGDIGHAVQQLAESYNYGVIRPDRPRHWPREARGSRRAQLRHARPRRASAPRNDDCHRAHDRPGALSGASAARWLDDRNQRSQALLALRAHHRHHKRPARGAHISRLQLGERPERRK